MPPQNDMPDLFVVDGSNIATEGRDKPSLDQLNEAITAFHEEYPDIKLTVVVDATFGHRIAKKEVAAFDKAVARNEIVTPPAGAVGRGDAFILAIAHKAGAGVLSNDSFQEFHGEYGWLFEHGRLIGGKPVPHVGWVFVDRNPVRGPASRRSVKAAKSAKSAAAVTESKERANRRVTKKAAAEAAPEPAPEPVEPVEAEAASGSAATAPASSSSSSDGVNELVPFLDFVEHHPVGTRVTATVDSYSSHGAYARVDQVLVYIPLRLMADPPPTSARKVLKLGDEVEAVVAGFVPDRRSIDVALPAMAPEPATAEQAAAKKTTTKKAPAKKRAARKTAAATKAPAKKAAAKKTVAKKTTAAKKAAAKKTTATKKTVAKKTTAAKKTAAKKTAAKASTAKTTATKKAPAKKRAATRRRTTKATGS